MRSLTFGVAVLGGAALASDAVSEERTAEIVAAQVREQGHPCDEAKSAKRDEKASEPGEAAWILTCGNAVYRVRLIPDMQARIERVEE